jgi:hypothetical protein
MVGIEKWGSLRPSFCWKWGGGRVSEKGNDNAFNETKRTRRLRNGGVAIVGG